MPFSFVVEQAGCESCAGRVSAALAPLGVVDDVVIDEANDVGLVRMTAKDGLSEKDISGCLLEASTGSGHAYRVRPGSWQTQA